MGKHKRNHIAGVAISSAGDHDACAVEFFGFERSLQLDGHLGPNRDAVVVAKLDAILANANVTGGKAQVRAVSLNGDGLDKIRVTNFSCAHKFVVAP